MSQERLSDIHLSRVRDLADRKPDLVAEVRFYPTSEGGRNGPVPNGYGCPCLPRLEANEGSDARFLFEQDWVELGETVTAKLFFMGGQVAADRFRQSKSFCLWEGKIIGKGKVA